MKRSYLQKNLQKIFLGMDLLGLYYKPFYSWKEFIVSVPDCHFHPSLIFVGKLGAYL
jgi:hypothetical protein